jgi:hypothetical protein
LLNDPQFVEAGRRLSQRLIEAHGTEAETVLAEMFRTLSGRRPTAAEGAIIEELYAQQRAYFEDHPQEAERCLQTGDSAYNDQIPVAQMAACSVVASTLLNFEGFTRKP